MPNTDIELHTKGLQRKGKAVFYFQVLLTIISGLRIPAISLVERFLIWRYIHRARRRSSLTFLGLTTKLPPLPSLQVHMAARCWMNFSVIWKTSLQVQGIWKDGKFSKSLLSPFQELAFKEYRNRKRRGYVDRQQDRSIDRNLFFFKLTLLIFRRWRHL